MKVRLPALWVLCATLLMLASAPSAEEHNDSRGSLSFVFENDGVFSDRNYTSGVRLGFLSGDQGESGATRWLARHLLFADPDDQPRFGVAIGQSIFTPENTGRRRPRDDQRPYAAWLYGGFSLLVESDDTLDTLALELGVVGPSALGEDAQVLVHRALDIDEPQGWDFQLRDEFGAALHFERKWRLLSELEPSGVEFDVTPSLGFSAGNVLTHAGVGLMLRLGDDLRNDFGPPRVRPSLGGSGLLRTRDEIGGYFFLGVTGRAIAHNLFLDGNTGRSEPDVAKRALVADIQVGATLQIYALQAGVTVVMRTSEFRPQEQPDVFSSLFLALKL